jgi:hypothetical protein
LSRTVGVLHYPLGEDYGISAARKRTPRRLYRRALWYKANPRPPAYMESLFCERYPEGVLTRTDGSAPPPEIQEAERVVLLYPDAIGLGFGSLERRLERRTGADVRVLNGRRRDFVLGGSMRARLAVRRLLERSMAPEAMSLLLLALATPVLLAFDLLRGRR